MDYFVDWNCRLFPSDRIGSLSVTESLETMQMLFLRNGFSHFCIMTEYTGVIDSVPAFLIFRNQSERALREQLPRHLKVKVVTSIPLFEGLHQMPDLDRFCIAGDRFCPLRFPSVPTRIGSIWS